MKTVLRLLLVIGAFMVMFAPAEDAKAASFTCAAQTGASAANVTYYLNSSGACSTSSSGSVYSIRYNDFNSNSYAEFTSTSATISSVTSDNGLCTRITVNSRYEFSISGFNFTCSYVVQISGGDVMNFTVHYDSSGIADSVSASGITSLPYPPTVTSITPTAGPTAGGTTVILTGTNFTGATAVNFGSTTVVPTVNSSTQITVT